MKKQSSRLTTFTVSAKLNLEVDVEIEAKDLDDALAKSKELQVHDFVDILGNWLDGDAKITGLFENSK